MQPPTYDPLRRPEARKKQAWEGIRETLTPIDFDDKPMSPAAVAAVLVVSLVAAALLFLLLHSLLSWRRARRDQAERIVHRRLNAKELSSLDQKALFEELHAALVEYLAARRPLPAKSLTTREILRALPAIPELEEFLLAADHVRYSGRALEDDTPQARIAQCRRIIKKVKKGTTKARRAR